MVINPSFLHTGSKFIPVITMIKGLVSYTEYLPQEFIPSVLNKFLEANQYTYDKLIIDLTHPVIQKLLIVNT